MTCRTCSRLYCVYDPVDGSETCVCYLKKRDVNPYDFCEDWNPSIWITNKVLMQKTEEFSEWLKRTNKKS